MLPKLHYRPGDRPGTVTAGRIIGLAAVVVLLGRPSHGGDDWPMWRHDAARSGYTAAELPRQLQQQWLLSLPKADPAWPAEQGKIQFDQSYQPVVAGTTMYIPLVARDALLAVDTRTGRRKWIYSAGGPIRFAPVATAERVYFVCDDGHLYCLDGNGQLVWKVRGGPDARMVLGNDRLVSMWPARGGPVLVDDTVYFAAGIWPFMGIFIHAVDATTGRIEWTNSGSGSNYIVQQHNSPAFAGIAPQGYLAANDDTLLVSGGMTVPAAYDLADGTFRFFRPGERSLGKNAGGFEVLVGPGWYCNFGGLYRAEDGEPLAATDIRIVSPDTTYALADGQLIARDAQLQPNETTSVDRLGRKQKNVKWEFPTRWQQPLQDVERLFIRAGSRLYAGHRDQLVVLQLGGDEMPNDDQPRAHVIQRTELPAAAWSMLAADDRLFVVTVDGQIACFADLDSPPTEPPTHSNPLVDEIPTAEDLNNSPMFAEPAAIVQGLPQLAGYAVVWGAPPVDWLLSICRETEFHILIVEADAELAERMSQWLLRQDLLGTRVGVVVGTPQSVQLPAYLAQLVIVHNVSLPRLDSSAARMMRECVRPYGGQLVLPTNVAAVWQADWQEQQPLGFSWQSTGDLMRIVRPAALPGSAPWTHQNGDAANTLVSADQLLQAPLGLLWFGGPSNQEVLPRHGHGPTPQVIGGRLFIEGPDMLRAVDVYTGRLLWQRSLPGVGQYYDNTGHHPGAGAIGSNYVSTEDGIYVAWRRQCLRLDPITGQTLAQFQLPDDASGPKPYWGYLGVRDRYLIAGSSPVAPLASVRGASSEDGLYGPFGEGSRRLVVMDRYTGQVLWTRDATYNFRHNAIVAGKDTLFCLDRITPARLDHLRRRGLEPPDDAACLWALDLASGEVRWQTTDNVFGTWLAYQADQDVLLQAGSMFRDRSSDETGRGMILYDAATGDVRWTFDDAYGGPPLLYPDRIITQGSAFDLADGKPLKRTDPLTGQTSHWTFQRNYGCNVAIGCANLLTFRSAAAGYFDLAGDGGTGNWGGFRSSCTSNLVPADGVLNAPDYTRTCNCSYQNQCSLALIPMPDVETWTFNAWTWNGERVERLGLNFAAPGDRRVDDTLWLDVPSVGGPSPNVPCQLDGRQLVYDRLHASQLPAASPAWVFASGVGGLESLQLRVKQSPDGKPRQYRVRLYFAQLRDGAADRIDVWLQDHQVLDDFDAAREAGGVRRGVIKQFDDVTVDDLLELRIDHGDGDASGPHLCGLEIELVGD